MRIVSKILAGLTIGSLIVSANLFMLIHNESDKTSQSYKNFYIAAVASSGVGALCLILFMLSNPEKTVSSNFQKTP